MMPLPQLRMAVDSVLQAPTVPLFSPSSQISPAQGLTMPSPQVTAVQFWLRVAVSLPSSHSSPSSMMPLPQTGRVMAWQVREQWFGVPLFSPSSQTSPSSMTPLPQTGVVVPLHWLLQWFGVPFCSPSSQVSPAQVLTMPSPQRAAVQSALQLALAPTSSHSSPASTMPLPQTEGVGPSQRTLQ